MLSSPTFSPAYAIHTTYAPASHHHWSRVASNRNSGPVATTSCETIITGREPNASHQRPMVGAIAICPARIVAASVCRP